MMENDGGEHMERVGAHKERHDADTGSPGTEGPREGEMVLVP